MLTSHVHPRLGIPKFTQFHPFFLAALQAFDRGEDTEFKIEGGLSPNTVAARMRDSIMAYRINTRGPMREQWLAAGGEPFNTLFVKHDHKFVIAGPDNEGRVMFRHKKFTGKDREIRYTQVGGELPKYIRMRSVASPQGAVAQQAPGSDGLRAKDSTDSTVRAFFQLKLIGQLDQPVVFPGPVTAELTTELQSQGDFFFHFDPDRNETVLM
jgi:hypothetical protein